MYLFAHLQCLSHALISNRFSVTPPFSRPGKVGKLTSDAFIATSLTSNTRLGPNSHSYTPGHSYLGLSTTHLRPPRLRSCSYGNNDSECRSWPPSPAVEDEIVSLAKEADPIYPMDSDGVQVHSQGTVDQLPIILDVSDNLDNGKSETRLRDISSSSVSGSCEEQGEIYANAKEKGDGIRCSGGPSGRENSRRESSSLLDTPTFSPRAPSPYMFSLRTKETTNPADTRFTATPDFVSDTTSRAARRTSRYKERDRTSGTASSRDWVNEDDFELSLRDRTRDPRQSTDNTAPARSATYDSQPRLAELKARVRHDPRRASESASTMQNPRFEDVAQKTSTPSPPSTTYPSRTTSHTPSPQATPGPKMTGQPTPTIAPSRKFISRPPSRAPSPPNAAGDSFPISPPRSPRLSAYNYRSDSPRSEASSRTGSRSVSRPSSPAFDMTSSHGSFHAKPSSRLSSSMLSSYMLPNDDSHTSHETRHSDAHPPPQVRGAGPLPYPVDDMNLMPSEEDHRYKPRELGDSSFHQPLPQRSSTTPQFVSLGVPPARPLQHMRRPSTEPVATPIVPDISGRTLMNMNEILDELPVCPRPHRTRDYNEWYTLDECSSLNICPVCLDATISRSNLRRSIRRASRRDKRTRCDFSSPWVRRAWVMALQHPSPSLDLLCQVAKLKAEGHSCPGDDNTADTEWFTLTDNALPIPFFDICLCDVLRIEALFPALRVFSRNRTAPLSSGVGRRCNFRADSKRLPHYLDLLAHISATAESSRRPPDMQPFIEYLSRDRRGALAPCTRDDLVLDQTWHFADKLPSLTVCGACFHGFALAFADASPGVAGRLARTPRRAPLEDEARAPCGELVRGSSCQLYSQRMRRVFRKACQRDDWEYLARKVRERRAVELESQASAAVLMRALSELDRDRAAAGRGGDRARTMERERGRLEAELGGLVADWRKWE